MRHASADRLNLSNGEERPQVRLLRQGVDEIGVEDIDAVHFAFKEQVTGEVRNGPSFAEQRRVLIGKFRCELTFGPGDKLRRFPSGGNEDS